MVQTVRPLVQEKTRLQWEKNQKLTMVVNTSMAVTAIVGSVVMGYKVSSLL
ncbi:hypothetical protein BS78_03G303400 [Paspalum vaginatum]|nr:hypothetical protein BS78_03G303400 [Paspalum vaginatum]